MYLNQRRKFKWDKKADLRILICYNNVGYRVLINNRTIVARHVDVIEKDEYCIGLRNDDELVNKNEILDNKFDSSDEFRDAENENENVITESKNEFQNPNDKSNSKIRPKRNVK